tara:strand:- start:68 stop:640 length:573 start_codon:yes stop_codon:yes gene_type:complete
MSYQNFIDAWQENINKITDTIVVRLSYSKAKNAIVIKEYYTNYFSERKTWIDEQYRVININPYTFLTNIINEYTKKGIGVEILDYEMFTKMKKLIEPDYDKMIKKSINVESITKTYIMKDSNTGYYKIGRSIKPKHREKTLQSEKPSINMVKIFDRDIEYYLHKKYRRERLRGEWFRLTKLQVHYICTHY